MLYDDNTLIGGGKEDSLDSKHITKMVKKIFFFLHLKCFCVDLFNIFYFSKNNNKNSLVFVFLFSTTVFECARILLFCHSNLFGF